MPRAPVFDQTRQSYLEQIACLDFGALKDRLGIALEHDAAVVPVYGRPYRISPAGVMDPEGRSGGFEACVILSKYLLHASAGPIPTGGFCTFKDFRDAAPLVSYFSINAEGAIARRFAGRRSDLEAACRHAGGTVHASDLAYHLKYRFQGLPKIPVYLLFNDREEGFAAQCTLLFERSAGYYLDMETLAILGVLLAQRLYQAVEKLHLEP